MLIFDDYLHGVRGIISRIAFPWVCPFQALSSPSRTETQTIVVVALQTGLKTAHFCFQHGSSPNRSTSYYDTVMLPRYYLLLYILDVVCF